MRKIISTTLTLFLLLGISLISFAQEELREVTTDGLATIYSGDVAHARDLAIQDALRNAVEQVTGAVMSSESMVVDAMLVKDEIYSHSRGYVSRYAVLTEGKGADGTSYEVKIKAAVRVGPIEEDLRTIIKGAGNPRMMVLISERNIGQTEYSGVDVSLGIAENAVIENMRNKGFEFVDQETAEKNIRRDKAIAALEGDAIAAAAIGEQAGAEVIITGKAFAKEAPGVSGMLGGMKSMQATVTAKAFNSDDAKVLVSKTETGKAVHIDEVVGGTKAIEQAATQLAEYMSTEILKHWTKGAKTVTLRIRGVRDYTSLTDLIDALKNEVRGIKGVTQRDYTGTTALLEVETRFDSNQLAYELTVKPLEKFTTRVTSKTANRINLRITPKTR